MWRSEPQIAVEVTRTMASRRLRIWASGTSRTSTRLMPIQQFAFMPSPAAGVGDLTLLGWAGVVLVELVLGAAPERAAVRAGDLARLDDLLEPAKGIADLLVRLLTEHLGDHRAEGSAGRGVAQHGPHLGS